MSKQNFHRHLRNYLILAGYLVFFVLGPFWIVIVFNDRKYELVWVGYLALYVLFFAPFLFVVPYKLSGLKSALEKFLFIVLGLIIPFLFIYLYNYWYYLHHFHPGF